MNESVKAVITLLEELQRELSYVFGGVAERYEKNIFTSSSKRNISPGS